MTGNILFSYYISLGVLTVIVTVTFVVTAGFLFSEAKGDSDKRMFSTLIQEKNGQSAEATSYSRVAGVLGAMALSALFICTIYWVHYALFMEKSIAALSDLWPLFTVGAALFAPYAFNQVSQIGKSN